jgi:hypothetical protein
MRSECENQNQSQHQRVYLGDSQCGFDFDFNILTAFIRLGRAGPDRGRVPSIVLLLFDFFDFFDFG